LRDTCQIVREVNQFNDLNDGSREEGPDTDNFYLFGSPGSESPGSFHPRPTIRTRESRGAKADAGISLIFFEIQLF
jgi:hypothetical protein